MFTPWIKRKSLKHVSKNKRLVVDGAPPSLIMLLTLSGLLVAVGIFVVNQSRASNTVEPAPTPTPMVDASTTPMPTPAPSAMPLPSSYR